MRFVIRVVARRNAPHVIARSAKRDAAISTGQGNAHAQCSPTATVHCALWTACVIARSANAPLSLRGARNAQRSNLYKKRRVSCSAEIAASRVPRSSQ
jgi:hypothetical protein